MIVPPTDRRRIVVTAIATLAWMASSGLVRAEDDAQRGTGEMVDLYATSLTYGGLLGLGVAALMVDLDGPSPSSAQVEVCNSGGGGCSTSAGGILMVPVLIGMVGMPALVWRLDDPGLPRGVPRSMALGIRLGLAESFLGLGAFGQYTDANRVVLVAAAGGGLGLGLGVLMGARFAPSYRASCVIETTWILGAWGGMLAGIAAGQDGEHGARTAFIAANGAMLGGMGLAALGLAPSGPFAWLTTVSALVGTGAGALVAGPILGGERREVALWAAGGAVAGALVPAALGLSYRGGGASGPTSWSVMPVFAGDRVGIGGVF